MYIVSTNDMMEKYTLRENLPLRSKNFSAMLVLACVTEQTHEIRVYGLCNGARFAVPHNFA